MWDIEAMKDLLIRIWNRLKRTGRFIMLSSKRHLNQVGEGYFSHMHVALIYFLSLSLATVAVLIHAFVPGLFKSTASSICREIISSTTERMGK